MTSSNSLLLFSLGPVQDFIAASRKTKDLFGGSLLLSYLSGIAIETVSKYTVNGKPLGVESIIFPSLKHEKITPLGTAFPNRFLAIVPSEEVKGIATAAEKSVRDKMQEIANGVISLGSAHSLVNEIKSAGVDQYKSQVENFVECYWAAVEWNGVPADYGSTYERVEGALGQRKLIRNFKQIAEQGEKCSLIPSLVDVVNAKSSGGKERLSGVAIVKRFFPDWQKAESKFPSTSTVAVSDFVKDILLLSKQHEKIRNLAGTFAEKVKAVTSEFASQPLPMTKTLADQNNLSEFATIDGDWFFEDQYESENLRKALEEEKSNWIYPRGPATAAKNALRALLKGAKELDINSPSKYYAVIRFDGDRMGKWLSGAFRNSVSIDAHRQLSDKLLEFSGKLKEIVERRHCGQIVYAGGDDVLAFVTLRDCLNVSKDIREAYAIMENAAAGGAGEKPTGSLGIVIAHHKDDLKSVMTESRSAEHFAKEAIGRDAVSISLLKRSGDHTTSGAKWKLDGNLDTVEILNQFGNFVKNRDLAKGFIYDYATESDVLSDVNVDAAGQEFKRLFLRRLSQKKKKATPKAEIVETVSKFWKLAKLKYEQKDENEKVIATYPAFPLFAAAQFIAKGGNQ